MRDAGCGVRGAGSQCRSPPTSHELLYLCECESRDSERGPDRAEKTAGELASGTLILSSESDRARRAHARGSIGDSVLR